MSPRVSALALFAFASLTVLACGGREYARGADDPSVDREAISTLDKVDLERTLQTLLDELRASAVMDEWRDKARDPATKVNAAVAPFINETSERIDPQLDAMLTETERWLHDASLVHVVSREQQASLSKTSAGAQSSAFDPAHVAQYGKQLGVQYFITGKVGASDAEGSRHAQYFLLMQVINTSTSEILWQQKADVTKAVR
jgi:PBP1b-binding outer membrane lipoprotein LpoB